MTALSLRPYQIEKISEARALMSQGKKSICLVSPTGSGKTIIAAHIVQSAISKGRRVLFLAHRRELIDQCAAKLRDLGIWDYNVVLSGHPHSRNPDAPVQIASIQTLIRREYPPADLVIVDEAHHAASGSYQTLLKNYPNAYVLGLTATPERLDGKGLDSIFHDLLNVATVPELVDSGYLVAPQCMGPSQEAIAQLKAALARVKQRGGDYADDQLAEAMDSPSLVGDIVSHWQEWGIGQKTIVFAAGIDHSQHIVQQFRSAGIAAAHLDGTMSLPEREGVLKAWRGAEIDVVSNCQILCLDEKTEILTDSGWVGIDGINPQSRVANWDNGSIFFEEPLDIFKRDRGADERMFSIHHHSARVTAGHNILFASGRKQDVWKKRPVESLVGKAYAMPVSGLALPKPIDLPVQSSPKSNRGRLVAALSYHLRKTHGMPSAEARSAAINRVDTRHSMRYTPVDNLTDEQCRFIGLFHADGTKTPLHKGGVEFRFSTSKHQPFIVEAFNRVFDGVDCHRIEREKQSTIDWSFPRGTGGGNQKRAGVFEIEIYLEKGNLDFLWGLNEHQFDAFIYGFWLGDGNHGNDGIYNPSAKTICLFQANPAVLDVIQAVAVCRKYKSYLSYKSNGEKFSIGTLFLSKKSTHSIASRHSWVEESDYTPERVWCVKTSSGNIISRRNGSVTVMGNCEGFDFPELSCCILARPTKSVALYLQMCLDEKTEILTRRGFVGPDSILPCDEVAAMDIHSSDHKIEWTPILSITDRPIHHSESMFAIQSPSLDIRVTDAHRMVYRTKLTSVPGKTRTDWRVDTAANLHKRKTGYEIPVAGIQDAAGLPLTDAEIRFIGWVMTDGTINKKNGAIYIYQAEHQPYRVDIEKCLNDCGFKFGVDIRQPISQYNATSKRYCYSVSKGAPRGVGKHLRGWGDLEPFISKDLSPRMEDINNRQLGVLLEAMHLGDGAKQIGQAWTRRSYHISTGNKTMADRLQSLCVRRGYRCNVAIHHYNVNPLYVLHIKINQPRSVGGSSSPDRKSLQPCSSLPGERVWCVENALGTIVIRRNGKVAIVGNCGRVLRTAPSKQGAIILDHAGNVVEHGPPHIERVWTLGGFAKKRKIETTHACFLPGCGALFVEKDAGAVWWVSVTQAAVVENYRFMARKFERMDRSSAEFSKEAKLLICPACGHADCKLCGSHFQPPSADSHDRLVCPQCQAEYSSDRLPGGEQKKRGLVEALDGSLVLIGADSPAIAKLKVKNEYNRLLELARQKNHKRGWVWHKLKEQFSEEQLREGLPWHRASWWKQGAAEHGREKS